MKMISVIIPCYNVENYIEQCLESIINQSYKDIQIICVDDGSADNTPDILSKYSAKDVRIQIITQHNHGISAARNTGLQIASGDYIAFVDGDDWLETDAFEHVLN